jgi:hypothetical protein
MDCNKCQNYKPVWSPAVARYTPAKPLPDGAVCVAHLNNTDWYWLRDGQIGRAHV